MKERQLSDHDLSAWQALRLYGAYRLVLAFGLCILIATRHLPEQFGQVIPSIFNLTAFAYLLFAVISSLLIEQQIWSVRRHTYIQTMVDFTFLGIFLFTSGGVGSGLGLLIVITVAAGSLLVMGRVAYFFAAVASLIVLANEAVLSAYLLSSSNYTQAGLLGMVFFMTAFLAHTLAARLRESEALAAQRGADLESLSRLNERIVQRMRSGVMVVNQTGQIELANVSAVRLLGTDHILEGRKLHTVSTMLDQHLQQWKKGEQATRMIKPVASESEIQVSLTSLGKGAESEILIFLEDAAAIRQRAQQLKLASLGQLTASIAHEVRNPLGAISHAVQLLEESPSLPESDQRLLQIVHDHSSRVNKIIDNVLGLGKRDNSVPESFLLKNHLQAFVDDFCQIHDLGKQSVSLTVEPGDLLITMDQSQFEQVLNNLCENALRYSQSEPKIELIASIQPSSERPILDIRDTGPGIASELADKIFEPFFTDRSSGTGLGLYIASELCEANQAMLALQENSDQGCCFRITFPHPDKQIQIE